MSTLRVALAQINTTIGDFDGNVGKIAAFAVRARDAGADVVAFPELTITGYPPEDLLLRRRFIEDGRRALDAAVAACTGLSAVVGFVDADDAGIYNAAAIIHDGRLAAVYRKQRLPNYGVFDEMRYFRVDDECRVYTIAGVAVGVNICEDIWLPGNPTEEQAARFFGVPLAEANIQPIWLRIENTSDHDYWLLPISIDPDYYSADEAALVEQMHRLRRGIDEVGVARMQVVG